MGRGAKDRTKASGLPPETPGSLPEAFAMVLEKARSRGISQAADFEAGAEIVRREKIGDWLLAETCCCYGAAPILKALIECGADPKRRNSSGKTLLHCAAREGRPECVKALLEAGADPEAQSCGRKTPADEARSVGAASLKVFAENYAAVHRALEEAAVKKACAAPKGKKAAGSI